MTRILLLTLSVSIGGNLRRSHDPGLGGPLRRLAAVLLVTLAFALCLAMSCSRDGERSQGGKAPASGSPSEADEVYAEAERIGALGYVSWSGIPEEDRNKDGVTHVDESRVQPGLNLWNSLPRKRAVIMDEWGRALHSWERRSAGETDGGKWAGGEWGHVELFGNGDLLVFREGPDYLIRLDWNSQILWERPMLASHDADTSANGDIYVWETRSRPLRHGAKWVLVAKDYLVILAPDGTPKREISFFDLLEPMIDLDEAPRLDDRNAESRMPFLDPLHMNTLSIIREDLGEPFRQGRVLFASRSLNLIGVADVEREDIVWSWGAEQLDWPHQPVLTSAGNILIFDNGAHRGYSRIIEIDPASGEIIWEYRGDPPESFFCETMGGIQSLANGNILVTESMRGRAFELTREGEIVWEFFNPDVDEAEQRRGTLYRVVRISEKMLSPGLWRQLPSAQGG
jgi:hypothetical protein